MPRISRYKRRNSDRSGFTFYDIELVKDGPWKVAGEDYDAPPLSRVPLGGEGDITPGSSTPASANPTVYLTAAGGITPSFTHPWMMVSGSNGAVTLVANPQIARGREGQMLTLQVVDSSVTLTHGTGVNLMGSLGTVTIRSGGVITLLYTTGGTVWNETSRGYL